MNTDAPVRPQRSMLIRCPQRISVERQSGRGYHSSMRTLSVCSVVLLVACSNAGEREVMVADSTAPALSAIPALPKLGPVENDSGPAVRLDTAEGARRLVMVLRPGDQINALQPPVLQTTDGRRLEFRGPAVTSDSAYFVGDVVSDLAPDALPIAGTLTTSYCRAGESLCRIAKREVQFGG